MGQTTRVEFTPHSYVMATVLAILATQLSQAELHTNSLGHGLGVGYLRILVNYSQTCEVYHPSSHRQASNSLNR